jgi:hypothetical protein
MSRRNSNNRTVIAPAALHPANLRIGMALAIATALTAFAVRLAVGLTFGF